MKYLKLYENFTNQTPLERQFSEVVVAGLTNNDREMARVSYFIIQ